MQNKIKQIIANFISHRLLSTSAFIGIMLIILNFIFPVEIHAFVRWLTMDVMRKLIEKIVNDDRFLDYIFVTIGSILVYLKGKK